MKIVKERKETMEKLLKLMNRVLKTVGEESLDGFGINHNGYMTIENDNPLHILESFDEFESVKFVNGIYTYKLVV
jgi:hypothetical protein